jgi:hypothetical protein
MSKNHVEAQKLPFMDVREQPEGGGGQSGSAYWNFSTLCRRLLSCIPLDAKITS